MLLFIAQELCKLIHEGVYVLEAAVDGGKADIGDLVNKLYALHNHFAYLNRTDLALKCALKLLLDLVSYLFKLGERYRALFAGTDHAVYELNPVKLLA